MPVLHQHYGTTAPSLRVTAISVEIPSLSQCGTDRLSFSITGTGKRNYNTWLVISTSPKVWHFPQAILMGNRYPKKSVITLSECLTCLLSKTLEAPYSGSPVLSIFA